MFHWDFQQLCCKKPAHCCFCSVHEQKVLSSNLLKNDNLQKEVNLLVKLSMLLWYQGNLIESFYVTLLVCNYFVTIMCQYYIDQLQIHTYIRFNPFKRKNNKRIWIKIIRNVYITHFSCITEELFNDYYYHLQRQQLIYWNTFFLNYRVLNKCFQD